MNFCSDSIAGWGSVSLKPREKWPKLLQRTDVRSTGNGDCNSANFEPKVDEGQMCSLDRIAQGVEVVSSLRRKL